MRCIPKEQRIPLKQADFVSLCLRSRQPSNQGHHFLPWQEKIRITKLQIMRKAKSLISSWGLCFENRSEEKRRRRWGFMNTVAEERIQSFATFAMVVIRISMQGGLAYYKSMFQKLYFRYENLWNLVWFRRNGLKYMLMKHVSLSHKMVYTSLNLNSPQTLWRR